MRIPSLLIALVLLLPQAAARADEAGNEFFEKKIRPLLVEKCFRCHSREKKKHKGGLELDSRSALLRGGDNGPALAPGDPAKSRIIEAVSYKNIDLTMPPRGKLPDEAIADLTAWVKMGAPWPGGDKPVVSRIDDKVDIARRRREHWAWQPLKPVTPPKLVDPWARTNVDRFILKKLRENKLEPAGKADRRTLLRRVYFDLVGLPPTPEEVQTFLDDKDPRAFEKVVDRLLAAPTFGERWARHWLDLVRYAESRGHEFDYTTPNAYQYRDYVIRALNADVPYDQFVTEHLAGDLLAKPRLNLDQRFNESILGTGFWFLGEEVHSPVDIRQDEADRVDNQIDVMTKTFLGLTVACARCHDHKFDAISTMDYYALAGFLQSSSYRLARFDSMEPNRQVAADLWKLRDTSRARLGHAVHETVRPTLDRLADYLLAAAEATGADRARLQQIAAAGKLDADLLAHWVKHLDNANKDARDPFHAFARLARTKNEAARAALLKTLVADMQKREEEFGRRLGNAQLVVDYAASHPHDWLTDGYAFGARPSRPGDLRLSANPAWPLARVVSTRAAWNDPTWDVLKLAPGTQNDPGALGQLVRAGRTLRTPSFAVGKGRVYYLVKGKGIAYAAVDSHKMIKGPLHGRIIKSIDAGPGFQWIAHDLNTYEGHRIHLEFTARPKSEFAVALVVQSDKPPARVERPNQQILGVLAANESDLKALAAGYQKLFSAASLALAEDRLADAVDHAELADWLVRHRDLLLVNEALAKKIGAVAGPILAERDKIVASIQRESRLALALVDGTGENEYVFLRGSYKAQGPTAERRLLEALAGSEPMPVEHGSGRLALARQIVDPRLNPLTPRVQVNRLWHHLFGRGLVASVDNFGVLGARPTHPELLDYLADRFVRAGWSNKKLIKELVLSNTYQLASTPGGAADKLDPDNLLLHRARIRRLEGEAIRDALLRLAGSLDKKMYGPSVPVHLTEFQQGRGRPGSGPLDGAGRRSVYLAVRRNFLSSFLLAYDTPIPFSTVGKRTVSNVPAQALILLNDPFVHQQAERWANRIVARKQPEAENITRMYQEAYGREPNAEEQAACSAFLKESSGAWKELAHTLMNAKEFIYVR